jgi:hypothetical protein
VRSSVSSPKSSAWLLARLTAPTFIARNASIAAGGRLKKNSLPSISVVDLPRVEMQHSRLQTTRSRELASSRSAATHSVSGRWRSSAVPTSRPSITSPSSPIAMPASSAAAV